VAFCRLLTGSLLLEFDQYQVIYVLTKSKLSIEYKPVAKCSIGPEIFRKAIVDKNDTHFAHSARFICLTVSKRAVRASPNLLCPVQRSCWHAKQWAVLMASPQVSVMPRQLPVTTGQLFVLLFKEVWLSDTQILSFCMFQ
jgi:hypothetical protein